MFKRRLGNKQFLRHQTAVESRACVCTGLEAAMVKVDKTDDSDKCSCSSVVLHACCPGWILSPHNIFPLSPQVLIVSRRSKCLLDV